MSSYLDLTYLIGQKFGMLTILSDAGTINGEHRLEVKCDCGVVKTMRYDKIIKRGYKTCGCNGYTIKQIKKHPIYYTYTSMKNRCLNVNFETYQNYGGRGIKICDEWRSDIETFINWAITNGWQKGLQLDRIDNNGNYEPKNCRFVTSKQNNRNRRSNRFVEYNGRKLTVSEWSEIYGINKGTLRDRLNNNWDIEKAFTTKTNICQTNFS